MISWYGLGEASGTRVDEHGPNDLTDYNTVAQATGKVGDCADFEKDNSERLAIADASQTGLDFSGDMSISFWIYPESKPSTSGSASEAYFLCKMVGSGTFAYRLLWQTSSSINKIYFSTSGDGSSLTNAIWDVTIDVATWYHIMIVKSGTSVDLYINNVKIGSSGTVTSSIANSSSEFAVGAISDGGGYYDGRMDELALWSKAIDSTERDSLYNSGNGISYADTSGSVDVSTTPTVLAMTFSLPASTVTATQVVTVSPAVLSATFSTPTPAITGDSSVSPAPLVATFSLPTSNVITPDANVTPAVLVVTFNLSSPTVTAELNIQVDPEVLSATFSIPAPTVTLGVAITVEPEVLSATFSTPTPTITVVSNMTVSPETLVATFSLPISRTIGDFWQDKFTPASDPFVDKVYNAGDNWTDKY